MNKRLIHEPLKRLKFKRMIGAICPRMTYDAIHSSACLGRIDILRIKTKGIGMRTNELRPENPELGGKIVLYVMVTNYNIQGKYYPSTNILNY